MSQLDPEALEARLSAIASDMTDEDQVLSPANPVEAAQSPLGFERDG